MLAKSLEALLQSVLLWPQTVILLISASQEARITGVGHQHPAVFYLFIYLFFSFFFYYSYVVFTFLNDLKTSQKEANISMTCENHMKFKFQHL
jgi:hypothetical protein